MWILPVAFLFIFVSLLILSISRLIDSYQYESSLPTTDDAVKITFDQFNDWYILNPNRWEFKDNYVTVMIKTEIHGYYNYYIPKACYFNLKDWKKYKKFKSNLDNIEINKKVDLTTIKILEAVQEDINNFRKQATQEIMEANEKIIEIAERLNKK